MASHKHHSALLDTLNRKKVPMETTPQEVLSLIGVEAPSYPSLTFFDEELLLEGPLALVLCKSPSSAWVPRFQW